MNGRAYDYNLGRFYGVDPFIQFPSNSQSLNPYGYLMNNPLAGTDPTGYMGGAASRIESACDSTSVQWGGRDTGNSGNVAVTFDARATTNNGSEKSAQTVTVVFKPEQIKSIQERGVTSFNVNTDEKGKITGASWTLGPSSEEIRDVSMFNPQVAAGMSAISDAAARFAVGSYISGDSRGTYVALMEPGEWRMPGDDGIERVAPEMYFIGMGRPAVALAEGAISGLRGAAAVAAGSVKGINPSGSMLNCTQCALSVDKLLATGEVTLAPPMSAPLPYRLLDKLFNTTFSGWTSRQSIEQSLLSGGNGTRAVIYGMDEAGTSAHVWNAVVQRGRINYIDGQVGQGGAGNFDSFKRLRFGITSEN